VVIFVQNNEVPHIASYETHQRPQEISIVIPKRLLQQYLPNPEVARIRSPLWARLFRTSRFVTCPAISQKFAHQRKSRLRRKLSNILLRLIWAGSLVVISD
jgi:hypothetical protein